MTLLIHHWCAWLTFADHSAIVANWRGRVPFVGVVDPTGLLHRILTWK